VHPGQSGSIRDQGSGKTPEEMPLGFRRASRLGERLMVSGLLSDKTKYVVCYQDNEGSSKE
jgi:hypothetical protein